MCRGHFLAACIGLLLSWYHHGLSVATEPGFLDFDNLPETNFSCEGKVIGGYYADTETGCQMFHVCTIGQKGEVTDIKFLCLNGTVFDQETRVCERLDEVDCSKSESFYDLNLELYGNNAGGFGIQPESEDIPETLCEEEDEEECKTEKPPAKTSPTEQEQGSSEQEDETTTQPPLSSSTTSRRPVTSTSFPSTSPAPQILQFPSSSPETIAALLALHNAFTQSLQQHSNGKDNINPPKITGFVESLNREKATQEAETFEIKNGQTFSSRVPTQFPPKTQTQYIVPQSSSPQFQNPPKTQFQNPPKPQFQNPPKHQFSSPLKPQFQSPPKTLYQSPPKSQYQSQPKPQFNTQPNPPPITHSPVSYSKPIHTTSERFGNIPFRHSFHINSQVTHFHEPNYQDQYSDHETQPSSQPQTEAPKQYDFGDYEDDYYDEKPHSSTITPYLLHQLKVNQVQSASQAKVSESSNHGSFVREVSSASTKHFNAPSYRSVTTPGIAIITATSTTSSSSVKTGKPLQSAIQPFKKGPTGTEFIESLLHSSNSNDTEHSYDDYKEGDVRSDPFYKDVPKIYRNKRNIVNDVGKENSVTTVEYTFLRKFRGKLLNSMFKLNSDDVLHAILSEYCNTKVNSSDSLLKYCMNNNNKSRVSDKRLGDKWEIVIPKENTDHLYLVRTIQSSSEFQNSTSNILLLVHFPSEFKFIRDSILKELENEKNSNQLLKEIQFNSVSSSIHHRFKRVKRDNIKVHKENIKEITSRGKKSLKKKYESKIKRGKRQVQPSVPHESANEDATSGSYDNPRVRPVIRGRESHTRENQQRSRKVIRKRPHLVQPSEETGPQPQRPAQRRLPTSSTVSVFKPESPEEETIQDQNNQQKDLHSSVVPSQRRKPSSRSRTVVQSSMQQDEEQNYPPELLQNSRHSTNIPSQRRQPFIRPQSVIQAELPTVPSQPQEELQTSRYPLSNPLPVSNEKSLGTPSAGRRKQGTRYHFCEGAQCFKGAENQESTGDEEVEVSTTYPFNLKPGTTFNCDDKIKGGYYADVEAECYGYFICSQGAINGPLLKSHFWCGPTTKFNQRSRTCQAEANVACSVSNRYYHLNKDILSLPDPEDLVRDSFEPSKVKS